VGVAVDETFVHFGGEFYPPDDGRLDQIAAGEIA